MKPAEQAIRTLEFVTASLVPSGTLDMESRTGDIAEFAARCAGRITTEGRNQYYDADAERMLFEDMPAEKIREYLEEELLDAVNYAWMISHRTGEDGSELTSALFSLWLAHCR